MPEKNLEALFLHSLKDLYFAEQQIAKAMPAMIGAAESQELGPASGTPARETPGRPRPPRAHDGRGCAGGARSGRVPGAALRLRDPCPRNAGAAPTPRRGVRHLR